MKRQSVAALVLLLLIPSVMMAGGSLSSLINPEWAAGRPNYVRNWHLLNTLKISIFWGMLLCVAGLWLLACVLVIRSKKRTRFWLILAAMGPIGFAILAMLNDREPGKADRYAQFVRKMKWWVRGAYELCAFMIIWELAYDAMVLKRNLMIWYQSITTGVSTAQIIDIQNASSGMWAFGEGLEVMFLVVVFYVLRPIIFDIVGYLVVGQVAKET